METANDIEQSHVQYVSGHTPGLRFPEEFSLLKPATLIFSEEINPRMPWTLYRFLRRTNTHELLIIAEGFIVPNEADVESPKAGCAFMVNEGDEGYYSFPLEDKSPNLQMNTKTPQCATLRAIIVALTCRNWAIEGFSRIVIATSDASVVEGITVSIKEWLQHGWFVGQPATPVHDIDLWWTLMEAVQNCGRYGLKLSF
ncbi:hypothetical protein N7490_005860 [Penicillium lividum]|nr:hypothetical protein N7490_005860 [Penicillium lividum]